MKELKIGMGRRGERRLSRFSYADDGFMWRVRGRPTKIGHFVEVCSRKGLKVNAVKSKVMVLDGEEGLECEVCVDGIRLEYISEFKYWGCVLDE